MDCVAPTPIEPRRRKRKFADADVVGRLRRCEQVLKRHGIKVDDEEMKEEFDGRTLSMGLSVDLPMGPKSNPDQGTLIADKGESRYVEKCASSILSPGN